MSVVTNQGEVYVLNKKAGYEYNKARQLMSETFYSFEEDEIDVARHAKSEKRKNAE